MSNDKKTKCIEIIYKIATYANIDKTDKILVSFAHLLALKQVPALQYDIYTLRANDLDKPGHSRHATLLIIIRVCKRL